MDQILVEIALDGRIRYAIGALAGLGFAMVGLALLPQFLAEWPAITPRLLGLGFPILGLGMFLWLSFIPAPHALAIRADGSAVFTRSITTWWRFFDAFETLPPGAIKGVEVELAEAVLGTTNSGDTDTGASSREWRLVLRLADGTMREVQRS
ncbi:MAG: hypothetical protein ACKO9A_18665, partial [Alphaproteobacteria bacterium]